MLQYDIVIMYETLAIHNNALINLMTCDLISSYALDTDIDYKHLET